MLRRDARGGVPVLQLRGLIERDPRPDQVPWIARQPLPGQGGQLRAQLPPVPPVEPSRACIRYGLWCPAASARDQQFAFTPGASPST